MDMKSPICARIGVKGTLVVKRANGESQLIEINGSIPLTDEQVVSLEKEALANGPDLRQ